MREIFEQTSIGSMTLRNRLVRSATWEGMASPEGRATDRLTRCYVELARGGVGLIITGYAFVSPEGRQMHGKLGLHTDDNIPALRTLCGRVHAEGGRMCVQLVHAGGQSTPEAAGRQPLAPSAVQAAQYGGAVPAEMRQHDIDRIVDAFGAAAARAKAAGADAVQLHAAHGYLISQFLSPMTNRRTDEYGGGINNRARFMLRCLESVRAKAGDDFPVLVKLNGSDNLDGGLGSGDAAAAAGMLSAAGVDAIEVSCGTPASGDGAPVRRRVLSPEAEAYNLTLARGIRAAVSCPVICVGGFRSYELVERAIREDVDMVSLSRPLIRDPELPLRWLRGDRTKAACISCNKCFLAGIREAGIYCVAAAKGA